MSRKCKLGRSYFSGQVRTFGKIFWTLFIGTTKKDMAEMKDLFNLFDIDGNGSITQELFNDYLKPRTTFDCDEATN